MKDFGLYSYKNYKYYSWYYAISYLHTIWSINTNETLL